MSEVNPQKLIERIQKVLGSHHQLLRELERKLDFCLGGDLEHLQEHLHREKRLAEKVGRDQAGLRAALDGESLSECARRVEPSRRHLIESLAGQLRRRVREIQLVNRRNRRYIHSSLYFALSVLGEILVNDPKYNPRGYLDPRAVVGVHRNLCF
ncbi:MAG: flagellar export chaperone FlgN [Acidobacteriota bacterium]